MLYFRLICKRNFKTMRFNKSSRVWIINTIVWAKFEMILKVFDENSMEKFNFIYIWENVLLKIETSEMTCFYKRFFRFGRVGLNPLLTPCVRQCGELIAWKMELHRIYHAMAGPGVGHYIFDFPRRLQKLFD